VSSLKTLEKNLTKYCFFLDVGTFEVKLYKLSQNKMKLWRSGLEEKCRLNKRCGTKYANVKEFPLLRAIELNVGMGC